MVSYLVVVVDGLGVWGFVLLVLRNFFWLLLNVF